MNVFKFRNRLVNDYASYIRGFIRIADVRIIHSTPSAASLEGFK